MSWNFKLPEGYELSREEALRQSTLNRVATYNATIGIDDGSGVECAECLGKGLVAFMADNGNFATRSCKCAGTRLTIKRLQRQGLYNKAQQCTFDNFKVGAEHQRLMRNAALALAKAPAGKWLMLCGQSGAGKTHLCTAAFVRVCKEFGLDGRYLLWNADARELKQNLDDSEAFNRIKTCELLYIDDLFKDREGAEPSSADIRLAFEILDHRYNNALPTIISSEKSFSELVAIDSAIAGRIKQMCGDLLVSIGRDDRKNYRFFGAGT